MSITICESRLQLHLVSSSNIYLLSLSMMYALLETIQEFIQEGLDELSLQAKLVVSNHHSKRMSNGNITMMEILSESHADPSYRQPLNGDLIYSLCEGTTCLYQPVSINCLNHKLDSQRKNERVTPLPSLNAHHSC
jgi:hypothetical protein